MKRTPMPPRKRSLARVSKGKRHDERRAEAERQEWKDRFFGRCMACGRFCETDTHEIVRRAQSSRWAHTCNYLELCRHPCHAERFANVTLAPHAAQLALKRLRDPDHYCYESFLEVLGRPRTAVTPEEVELAYRTLLMIGA